VLFKSVCLSFRPSHAGSPIESKLMNVVRAIMRFDFYRQVEFYTMVHRRSNAPGEGFKRNWVGIT